MDQEDHGESDEDQAVPDQQDLAKLSSELDRKNLEVHIIRDISAKITTTLDLDLIFSNMLEALKDTFEFNYSMILLYEEEEGLLRVAAHHGYKEDGIGAEVKVGEGIIGVVAKRKKLMRMTNIGAQVAYMTAVKTQMNEKDKSESTIKLPGLANVQSQVAIPMLNHDRLIGVLAVESDRANVFEKISGKIPWYLTRV